jgi:phosphoribosylanthranilate isomerase
MKTRIKICCISSVAEAALAVRCGTDALGLVSAMPSGPGVIAEYFRALLRLVCDTGALR